MKSGPNASRISRRSDTTAETNERVTPVLQRTNLEISNVETAMRSSRFGQWFSQHCRRIPWRDRMLALIVKVEGGQLYSTTLRAALLRWYDVEVGPYSYGSLLIPGNADRHTVIGAYVSIGPNVRRFGAAHPMSSLSLHPFWYNPALGVVPIGSDVPRTAISIGHDSWIGANVTILPGCRKIGVGAVIGAGSVVTKDVPDFTMVAGNPARTIGTRLTESERDALLDAKPWLLPPAEAARALISIRDKPRG
jgi:virginiamycin A acetyltransferase